MCKMWLGDLEVANRHLRGEKHAATYSMYVTDNPHWEVDWLRDRTRAYERNSEARSHHEDKDEKFLKRESKGKDVSEQSMSTSDVTRLEERLMALISANNASQSKEGSSKEKNRGRSSSHSDASFSESSGEERKARKKKKKNKKKKKARDSRDKSAESDDHRKGKRRDKSAESDDHTRGRRREKSADSDDHKKGKRREKSADSDDHKKGKRRDQEDEGGMKRKWDDDKRKDQRAGVFDRLERDRNDRSNRDNFDRNVARDRVVNAWRGRGRGRGRGDGRQFDNRRLINRNPIWRPRSKDRVSWDNPKEKLAVGRNVFGLDPSEYYGPEVPPKKDNDKT